MFGPPPAPDDGSASRGHSLACATTEASGPASSPAITTVRTPSAGATRMATSEYLASSIPAGVPGWANTRVSPSSDRSGHAPPGTSGSR